MTFVTVVGPDARLEESMDELLCASETDAPISATKGVTEEGEHVWVISNADIPVARYEYLGDWLESVPGHSLAIVGWDDNAIDYRCIIIGI